MNAIASLGFICSILFFTRACTKDEIAGVPPCVRDRIEEIAQEKVWNPPAKVYRYTYRNQTVYFISQHCCDIPSQLLDANCNLLCAPDGGFTGKGDGACPDFFSSRTDEALIWKDPRQQ